MPVDVDLARPAHPRPDLPAARAAVYRADIQGLRSLAVLLVVVYHVWLGRVSGGVDVFLMISAFLLTESFVRKVEAGRPLELLGHWAHRFRRLLPAAVVTILGTVAAVRLLAPASRWEETIDQAWASLLYVQNWLLASRSVDYYAAEHATASPLQHFWSLSIQGQVFILWPILLALGAWVSRRTGWSYRGVLAVTFGTVFAASLACSVVETAANQPFAYFDSRARLWEFAAGSLLALALPLVRPPRGLKVVLGWAGLAALVAVGLVLPVERAFPGYVALWPILAAGSVLAAGGTGTALGADRFLSFRPLVALGNSSYALYLVHWPILVLYLVATGRESAGLLDGLAIVASSILLAELVTRVVETPLRRLSWAERSPLRGAVVILVSLALVAAPLMWWRSALAQEAAEAAAAGAQDNPGAAALAADYEPAGDPDAPTVPLPADQPDWFDLEQECEGRFRPDEEALSGRCTQSPAVDDPERVVVALGDSHTQQWTAAVAPLARERGWQIVSLLNAGCNFGDPTHSSQPDHCADWLPMAYDFVEQLGPDAVLTIATNTYPNGTPERVVPGYEETAARFTDAGIEVIALRDNPRFTFDPYECALEEEDPAACSIPLEASMATTNPAASLAGTPGVHVLDLTDLVCPDGTCPAVIGNVYAYFDSNHLTTTYLTSLAPSLEERLLASTGW